MITDLSADARELIRIAPELINKFADKVNGIIDNWDVEPDTSVNDEIIHAGYTMEQCGYEK